jgi:methylated-DNA-protein-cysteine methyltransferase-like protein
MQNKAKTPRKKTSGALPSNTNLHQKKSKVSNDHPVSAKKTSSGTLTNSKKTSSDNAREYLNKIQPSGKREESFFELVYEVARQIPIGRVTSYGAIAACLGTKLSARMVGWAMNGADKVNPTVPAHRVVNRVGLLSGKHHFKPPGKMEKLLKKEGILVKDDVIIDFKEKFWDPGKQEA